MRKPLPFVSLLPALVLAAAMPVLAHDDDHRELGAHVHGHGTLNIAIEDKRVSMELEAPGMDIVGFEHAASSAEQKAAVDKAKALLAKPLGVFVLPAAAACTLASADVELEAEHHDDDGHDHAAKEAANHDHDGHEHDSREHDKDDDHGGHNQFHATYAFDCANPGELTAITFDYFKEFAGARALTVNVVGTKGQSTYEVSRDKPTLDLAGIM